MHELVRVGAKRIVGEIIKLEGDTASIQCYEDTSGLSVGDVVFRTQAPLSVELGPGIMENIFDGIQRPLEVIFDQAGHSPFVPLGVDVPALDRDRRFQYKAHAGIREGAQIVGGTIIGEVYENELMRSHKIMVPPEVYGEVVAVYHGGSNVTDRYDELTITEPLIRIKHDETGQLVDVKMYHQWPVRKPRPVAEKMPGKEALITGQRVIDVLFPSVLGGTCAIPGAFGCGKTCISQVRAQTAARGGQRGGARVRRSSRDVARPPVSHPYTPPPLARPPAPPLLSAGAFQVLQHVRHRVRGLRRARQRDGGGADGLPGADDQG
jgi:V-type H+-transporting ATPase subunit A